jgi:hypothetical protein
LRVETVSISARAARFLRRIALALPLLALLVIGAYLLRLQAAHDDLYADTLVQAA